MRFKIVGANKLTGEDAEVTIDAADQSAAEKWARESGIIWSEIGLLDTTPASADHSICGALGCDQQKTSLSIFCDEHHWRNQNGERFSLKCESPNGSNIKSQGLHGALLSRRHLSVKPHGQLFITGKTADRVFLIILGLVPMGLGAASFYWIAPLPCVGLVGIIAGIFLFALGGQFLFMVLKGLDGAGEVGNELVRSATQPSPRNPSMICPHCHSKGTVTTQSVKLKRGVSGAKATAAILTGGVSLIATGLSRKEGVTKAHCSRCGNTWHF